MAVGSSSHGGTTSTLIERRSGSAWSIVPSVDTPATVNELFAVTCVRATDCVAVGTATGGEGLVSLYDLELILVEQLAPTAAGL